MSVCKYLILLLCAPLSVVEDDRHDGDVLPDAGQHLVQAHSPSAIPDIGQTGPVRLGHFGPDGRGEGVAAVAEAHGAEEAVRLVEPQVAVGHGADVADVGGDHCVLQEGREQKMD